MRAGVRLARSDARAARGVSRMAVELIARGAHFADEGTQLFEPLLRKRVLSRGIGRRRAAKK